MPHTDQDLLTADQLSEFLHVSARTIIRWRSEGRGPAYVRAGRRVRYRRADVLEWLERHRIQPVREVA